MKVKINSATVTALFSLALGKDGLMVSNKI